MSRTCPSPESLIERHREFRSLMTTASPLHGLGAPVESDSVRIARLRVIGFTGAAFCFLVSQLGLLWVLATGGIGATPTVASAVWLFSTLAAVLFLILVSDSYRKHPRWIAHHESPVN